jgi:hypothetical protein
MVCSSARTHGRTACLSRTDQSLQAGTARTACAGQVSQEYAEAPGCWRQEYAEASGCPICKNTRKRRAAAGAHPTCCTRQAPPLCREANTGIRVLQHLADTPKKPLSAMVMLAAEEDVFFPKTILQGASFPAISVDEVKKFSMSIV